jgi:DUF4097 and DUF4098 domain-containing protein YvlB
VEEDLNRSGDLARRARELAARAEALANHAHEAGEVDDELRKLEAELAALDEEQARLDRELGDYVHPPEEAEPIRDPEEGFTFRLGNLGDRIADIVNVALSAVGKFGAVDVIERSIDVGETAPVTVDSFAGSITVMTGDYGRVQVVAERHAGDDRELESITVDTAKSDDGVHVTARTSSVRPSRHWAQLTVTVPPGTPTRLRTRGGSVRVDGTAAAVEARTAGGSIRITGTNGPAELETAGGSIRAESHGGPIKAVTAGGSIRLDGGLTGVDASTIGGSVRVAGAYGPISAVTKGGSIEVLGRLSGACLLETSAGSVRLTLDASANVEIDATGDNVISDFDLVGSRHHKSGAIGDGSEGKVVARTVAGSVSIKRA